MSLCVCGRADVLLLESLQGSKISSPGPRKPAFWALLLEVPLSMAALASPKGCSHPVAPKASRLWL